MKNMLLEQKKIKLLTEWHFVEKKTEIMQNVLKMQYIFCCLTIWNEFPGVFSVDLSIVKDSFSWKFYIVIGKWIGRDVGKQ